MRQRARRDKDKAERVGAILTAARDLWPHSTWSDFTVGAVAARAGIVKGTVYLYFPSKERLLLAVCESYLEEYFDEVDQALARNRARWTAARVAETLAASIRGRDPLLRLLPILGEVLEHNLDYPVALAFKRFTYDRMAMTAGLLDERMTVRPGGGLRVLRLATALLVGLASTAFPAPVVEQVFHADGQLSALRVDLQRDFLHGVTALLRGMERET